MSTLRSNSVVIQHYNVLKVSTILVITENETLNFSLKGTMNIGRTNPVQLSLKSHLFRVSLSLVVLWCLVGHPVVKCLVGHPVVKCLVGHPVVECLVGHPVVECLVGHPVVECLVGHPVVEWLVGHPVV